MMLMVQTSEYIEDSHHQYELASSEAECGCACTYFICKFVYCKKQRFLETNQTGARIAVRRALWHTVRTWAVVGKK